MIKIENLIKKYGNTVVFDGFTYEFKNKGITCILGPSGCGKSTLFNLMAGFDQRYDGKIFANLCDISQLSSSDISNYRKSKIGFVFQEYNLVRGYTVFENIMLAADLNGKSSATNEAQVMQLLDRLGIPEKLHEHIENLSGGQKQRVAIARALINDPEVILADEPTGALDRSTANEIMGLFREIAAEKPVLIITHDKKLCEHADEVITIVNGKEKVLKQGVPDKDITNNAFKEKKENTNSIPIKKRAVRNFKNHFKRFIGLAISVSIGATAILFSLSSQNVIELKIQEFQEKNTAFSYGQILLDEKNTENKVKKLLRSNTNIDDYYAQYEIPKSQISYEGTSIDMDAKQFNSIANEVMNVGVMPQDDEIAISPSVARKMARDIKGLIGEEVVFSCGDFSKSLTISGIFNAERDDFYLGVTTEKQLYDALELKIPLSFTYKVNRFDRVKETEAQLVENGVSSFTASAQVDSFLKTFEELQMLFMVITIFVVLIAFIICIMILDKTVKMRTKEIGILMALGYKSTTIQQVLLFEGMLVSYVAVIATLIFVGISTQLSVEWPLGILFQNREIMVTLVLIFIFVSVVTLLASKKLLKTDPAKVLRS